jgi:hypothetical protein
MEQKSWMLAQVHPTTTTKMSSMMMAHVSSSRQLTVQLTTTSLKNPCLACVRVGKPPMPPGTGAGQTHRTTTGELFLTRTAFEL